MLQFIQLMKSYPIALLLFMLGFIQCSTGDGIDPNPTRKQVNCTDVPGICALSAPINSFGIDLFKRLHADEPESNIFISPLSISSALTMTANGASGETQSQMLEALKLENQPLANTNTDYQNFITEISVLDPLVKLSIANSIWYREGYPVKDDFLKVNEENFLSETQELDFGLPQAVEIINGWIEDNTGGLIRDMLDAIPGDAVMYLINAIYFKGDWLYAFDNENTIDSYFYKEDSSTVSIDMMQQPEIGIPYLYRAEFQAVDLPYGDSLFSMMLLLPNEGYTITDLIDVLGPSAYSEWVGDMQAKTVKLSLPRFKMEYKQLLNQHLMDMGMPLAFTDAADFSGIADASLKISRVIHQSVVELNEKGTEAAAATVVEIVETSIPSYPTLIFNKPFLFIIKERVGNNILFIGKMMDPSVS